MGLLCAALPLVSTAEEVLNLYDVIDRALAVNPEFLVERTNVQISEDQILRELGEFGWKVEAAVDESRSWDPLNRREYLAVGGLSVPTGNVLIYHEHRQTVQAALKKRLELGTEVALRTNFSRLVNSSNEKAKDADSTTGANSGALFTPELETFVGLSVSQPLMQGAGYGNTYAKVQLAEIKRDAAILLARVKAMNLVAEVASRYIDVLAAEKALALRKENLRRAEELVERNQRRQDVGVGVEIDVTTAELAVSQRRNELIETAAQKVERQNSLLGLIDRDPDFHDTLRFAPAEDIFQPATVYDPSELMYRARATRLDVVYYRRVVASAELNVKRARNASLPQLDLTATYGITALSEKYSEIGGLMEDRQGEEWSFGLLFKMDLEGKKVNSEKRVAQRQLFQAKIELAKAERSVGLEIDTALRRVDSARQRLETARQAEGLAAKRLEQEMQALEQGKGDLYRVVEQQQIFGDTQAEVVETQAFMNKAVIALWMSSGEVFDHLLVEPEQIRALLETAPSGLLSE